MEEVTQEIGNAAETFGICSRIGVSSEFASLKTIHRPTGLRVELRATIVEPFDMLLRNLVSVRVIYQLVFAVRDEVRKDKGRRLLVVIDTAHDEIKSQLRRCLKCRRLEVGGGVRL
jgi:hypothetical protein